MILNTGARTDTVQYFSGWLLRALKRATRWRWKGCEPPAFLHGGYNADTMRGYTAAERSGLCVNRILIVEDEATISRLIEVSLTRAGYACTVANDGLAAADQIEQQDFDLALLDIMLPGLTATNCWTTCARWARRSFSSQPKARPRTASKG